MGSRSLVEVALGAPTYSRIVFVTMRALIPATLLGLSAAAIPDWRHHDYPTIPMNGVEGEIRMPLVGLGTWQYNDTVADAASTAALKIGYRHIDTAIGYANQVGVAAALNKSGLKREEYFVTSKIPGGLNASETESTLNQALQQLGLDYVDLMLIHFPATWGGKGGTAGRKEEWLALERWAKAGKARAIGISHYCKSQIEDILSVATVPIALNQVRYHVGMGMAPNLGSDYKGVGIVYMSFSTLCGPCSGKVPLELINGPLVTEIAKAHGVSGAQVALRWAVQQGIPVVPKSSKAKHLQADFDPFSFTLTQAEMARLSSATTPATGRDDSGDCEIARMNMDMII